MKALSTIVVVQLLYAASAFGQTVPGHEDCEDCLPSFAPLPGGHYVVNAWVQREDAPPGTINYGAPTSAGPHGLRIDVRVGATLIGSAIPVGFVVDEWQLVQGQFAMPAQDLGLGVEIELICDEGTALFDDIRVFPADGSMKCYVYDPLDLRFVAELDERHYATFYEYDNEGKLVSVKKETERGRMTIQQTQHNTYHAQ